MLFVDTPAVARRVFSDDTTKGGRGDAGEMSGNGGSTNAPPMLVCSPPIHADVGMSPTAITLELAAGRDGRQ